jgi:hypothetical protein
MKTAETHIEVGVTDTNGADTRELSFRIPEGMSKSDLLEAGFALDGHHATKAVASYSNGDGDYVPLPTALLDEQRAIVKLLAEKGYEVAFN